MKSITGYAVIWDARSLPLGGFIEVVRRGTFTTTLKTGDPRALWNHNYDFPLGRKSAGTLVLEEDAKGLKVTITPPDNSYANDLVRSIQRGDVSGFSFGFIVIKDSWLRAGSDGFPVRELLEVTLLEISPCTTPAYVQTEAHVRDVVVPVASVQPFTSPSLDLKRRRLRLIELTAA
jgi:hypothetical protein